jgi:hypothetical protein
LVAGAAQVRIAVPVGLLPIGVVPVGSLEIGVVPVGPLEIGVVPVGPPGTGFASVLTVPPHPKNGTNRTRNTSRRYLLAADLSRSPHALFTDSSSLSVLFKGWEIMTIILKRHLRVGQSGAGERTLTASAGFRLLFHQKLPG